MELAFSTNNDSTETEQSNKQAWSLGPEYVLPSTFNEPTVGYYENIPYAT